MKDQLERQRAELENRKNMLMGASTTSSTPEAKKKKVRLWSISSQPFPDC
jgi:hypothetical protein